MRTRKIEGEIKPSLVPPIVAGLVSLALPGFGHMLARAFGKGLTLLLSFVTMAGLWIWRVRVEARREVDFLAMFQKSIQLRPILLFILILVVLIYFWIAYDAYKTADKRTKPKSGILWLLPTCSASPPGLRWARPAPWSARRFPARSRLLLQAKRLSRRRAAATVGSSAPRRRSTVT